MQEWKTYRIGDICKRVCSGGTPKSTEPSYYDGEIPWLNTKEINFNRISSTEKHITLSGLENSSAKWIDKNSVIVAMYGATAAKVAINTIPLTTNQACCNLSIDETKADYRFVYYWLCSRYSELASLANGGAQQNLNAQQIKDFEIKLPEIQTQQKIADLLWSIDNKIICNKSINDNLEQQAQALYKSWFVDFEPFKDGNFIDSEMGSIPRGWKIGKIKDIIDLLSGFPFKSSDFTKNGEYQLITIKGVQDGYLDVTSADRLSYLPSKMPHYCILKIGDILISLTGNVGRICIVDRKDLLLNQRVAIVSPKNKRDSFYAYTMFRDDSFKNELIHLAKGTAQLNLSPVETADKLTIIPPDIILEDFAKIGQDIFKQYVSTKMENIKLCEMRDSLLPKLMSGELKINEIDC